MILAKEQQPDGSYLLTGEALPEDTDFKTTKKITWLADGTNLIVANLIEYDHLLKTPKVDEDADFAEIVNVNSRFVSRAYVDSGLRLLNQNTFLQIQRRAYYRIDKVTKIGDTFQYNLILVPDGKKVGLASIAKVTDKKGDIAKKDLAEKVEDKKHKGIQKEKKEKKQQGGVEAKVEEGDKLAEVKVEEAPKPKKEKKEKVPRPAAEVKVEAKAEEGDKPTEANVEEAPKPKKEKKEKVPKPAAEVKVEAKVESKGEVKVEEAPKPAEVKIQEAPKPVEVVVEIKV